MKTCTARDGQVNMCPRHPQVEYLKASTAAAHSPELQSGRVMPASPADAN